MNYLTWIANLGVEPLLLFLAFLLPPALPFLALRLILVAAVRDAIQLSFSFSYQSSKCNANLWNLSKIMVFLLLIPPAFGEESLFLGKGEQTIVQPIIIGKYSIGNPEVISTKYIPEEKKLMIKALSIGFSDIVIWKGRTKEHLKIYVLSKRDHLKKINAAQSLEALGLEVKVLGEELAVYGHITEDMQLQTVLAVLSESKQKILSHLTLDKNLRNQVLAKIYKEFYKRGVSEIECLSEEIQIFCHYQGADKLDSFLDFLMKKYHVSLFNRNLKPAQNYKIKIHLVQTDFNKSDSASWGLDKVSSKIESLLKKGVNINHKVLNMEGMEVYTSTLAQPETMITLDHKNLIKLGTSVPFATTSTTGQVTTQWKFAGLSLELDLKIQDGKPFLCYKSELSEPVDQTVQGNQSESCVFISLNSSTRLFKLDLGTHTKSKKHIPLLDKIPILRDIFQSPHFTQGQKQIIAMATLSEER